MGEAKRRGSREQRIAQAVERRAQEDAARLEASRAAQAAEAERIRNLPPEQRKEAVLVAGGGGSRRHGLLLAAALAASAPFLAASPSTGSHKR